MKRTTLFVGALGALLLLSTGCDPFRVWFDEVEPAVAYEAAALVEAPTSATTVKVMTFNIKFGGGRVLFFYECNGTRYSMSEDEVFQHLDAVVAKINEVNPDVLMLQEADVQSTRGAYVDQLQYILDRTELNFAAYASQWKADYVPSDGIGRIDSGTAIASRWPVVEGQRFALPLIESDPVHVQYFYLKRNVLEAKVEVPGTDGLWAISTHSEAFSEDGTKLRHLEGFKARMDFHHDAGHAFVAGGDLNSLPPGSPQVKDFNGETCDDARFKGDDYTGEEAWMQPFYDDYTPVTALADYQNDPTDHFTFSGRGDIFWNRKLDYLFTNGGWAPGSGAVHQDDRTGLETLPLSDHAPIVAEWEVQ